MRRLGLILGAALLLASLAGCGANPMRASEAFSLEIPWDGFERLVVRTRNGGVKLVSGGSEQVRISGVKEARGLTLAEARENLDRLTIVTEPDQASPGTFVVELEVPETLRWKSPGASFDILVPERCAAEITTGNGAIHVRGLAGPVVLRTSNGRITVEQVEGEVEAATSNGRIEVDTVEGDCGLTTSNGRIRVSNAIGSVRATTSNGGVVVSATPPETGAVILRTSNGSIRTDLPPNLRGTLSVRTSNGRVETNLDGVTLTNPRWSKRSIEATLNGGGAGRISAETSNGSVTLNCR